MQCLLWQNALVHIWPNMASIRSRCHAPFHQRLVTNSDASDCLRLSLNSPILRFIILPLGNMFILLILYYTPLCFSLNSSVFYRYYSSPLVPSYASCLTSPLFVLPTLISFLALL